MLSVDNYAHDDAGTQGYNRYSYAHNNPLKYTDPDGEDPYHIGSALAGGVYNVATNWSKIKGWKSGLAYFGVGAAAGLLVSHGQVGAAKGVLLGGNAIIHAATGHLPQVDFKNAPGQSALNIGMYSLEAGLNAYGVSGAAALGSGIGTSLINGWRTWGTSSLVNGSLEFTAHAQKTVSREIVNTTTSQVAKEVGKEVAENGAKSSANGLRLSQHLAQTEKYGEMGVKELSNGRYRYYSDFSKANKSGDMFGRIKVREWDYFKNQTRTWFETIDHNGMTRIVRPEYGGDKVHFLFNEVGKFVKTF